MISLGGPRPIAVLAFWASAACGQEAVLPSLSVVKVMADQGNSAIRQGSRVVVGPGLVATNSHVTVGALAVRVSSGTQTWLVQSRKDDPQWDLSVLVVPGLPLPAALTASTMPGVGQLVTAMGFPSGLGPKASFGKITGLWSYLGAEVLQSDAITAPGSSGGGLFDQEGRLLGLTTFFFANSPGIHFSVPVRRIQERIAAYDRSLALRNDSPKVWNNLGVSLALLNRSRESEVAFRRALTLYPGYGLAWLNLGTVLLDAQRPEEASEALLQGMEFLPDNAEGWAHLGDAHMSLSRPAEASRHYLTALGLSPFRVEWWTDLARACDKAGDEPGLQKALARLAKLDAPQAKTLAKELKRGSAR